MSSEYISAVYFRGGNKRLMTTGEMYLMSYFLKHQGAHTAKQQKLLMLTSSELYLSVEGTAEGLSVLLKPAALSARPGDNSCCTVPAAFFHYTPGSEKFRVAYCSANCGQKHDRSEWNQLRRVWHTSKGRRK